MELKEFLDLSYTAYHAVENGAAMLEEAGFTKISLEETWNLCKGGKYYFTTSGTALIAFSIGDNLAFNVCESHTDSPCLKIKGSDCTDSPEGKRLNVEKYGGLVNYSMMNVPLKVAGRIMYEKDSEIVCKNVVSGYYLNIPGLCIHHNPTVNESLSLSVQNDMAPLFGSDKNVYETLSEKKVIDADLYVVPAVPAFYSGVEEEFLCSPRIDNLTSVYASIKAIIETEPVGISLMCCFDNEEIGSRTKQGADSAILEITMKKIIRGLGLDEDGFIEACRNGYILSVDNAHAVHPAHPEKSDVKERTYLNKGIVIKHHTNYSTDGLSSAILKKILREAGVEYQDYYNNSDLRCGGTIGLMTSANLGMNACDIGLAQLAMHHGIETVGSSDPEKMENCIKAFFKTKFLKSRDGFIIETEE